MGFTKELLDYARCISAIAYPSDAGSIHADCLRIAIIEFRRLDIPTLYFND